MSGFWPQFRSLAGIAQSRKSAFLQLLSVYRYIQVLFPPIIRRAGGSHRLDLLSSAQSVYDQGLNPVCRCREVLFLADLVAYLDRTRIPIGIDIGFGDVIYPDAV